MVTPKARRGVGLPQRDVTRRRDRGLAAILVSVEMLPRTCEDDTLGR